MITVELAPREFVVKSIQCHSWSCGGGIATTYKPEFGSNITFKINFSVTDSSLKLVLASIILQHNTKFSLFGPPSTQPTKLSY